MQQKEQELQNIRAVLSETTKRTEELVRENSRLTLEKGEFERLQKQVMSEKQFYVEEIDSLRASLDKCQQQLNLEVREKNKLQVSQQPIVDQLQNKDDIINQLKKENESLRFDNKKLTDDMKDLRVTFDSRIKSELQDYQQNNVDRIVALEKQLNDLTKQEAHAQAENQRLLTQNKQ